MADLSENPFETHSAAAPSATTAAAPSPAAAPEATPSPPVTNTGSPAAAPPANRAPEPTPRPDREQVNDPGIMALRAMFPDYDDLILQSVLQSAGGHQERAIDTLLGMSDPEYRSEAPATAQAPQPVLSQEELDEQFARSLVMQEQQQQAEQWAQAHPNAPGGARAPAVYQSTRPHAQQGWSQPGADQDRPSEFQEQFNKFAETGKKTIGSIFSKVKAKLQEFETGRPAGSPGAQQGGWTPPPAGGWTPPPAGGFNAPPQPQAQQYQAAYYDPNSNQQGFMQSSATAPVSRTPAVQGYDVTPAISPPPVGPTQTTTQQLQRQPSPQPVTIPSPQIGTTLDGGKLGLLPKRPVTLLRDPNTEGGAGARPSRHDDDDDDDGLEYAENPFESEPSGTGRK